MYFGVEKHSGKQNYRMIHLLKRFSWVNTTEAAVSLFFVRFKVIEKMAYSVLSHVKGAQNNRTNNWPANILDKPIGRTGVHGGAIG